MRKLTTVLVVVLMAVAAGADVTPVHAEPTDEADVCQDERSNAQFAAEGVTAPPTEAAAKAAVEKARRECDYIGGPTTKGRAAACKRWHDEAVASLANARAMSKTSVARRDTTARILADCIERERFAHVARDAESQAEAQRARDAEQRRLEAAAVERQRIANLANGGPVAQLALSALLCRANDDRARALRAIADEKRYARYGGFVDKVKLYDWTQVIRQADRRKVDVGRALQSRKLRAVGCGSAKVRLVARCIERADEECAQVDDAVTVATVLAIDE